MQMNKIQKMICLIVLIAVLIPSVTKAQNSDGNYTRQTFSQEELAQMLAPVALYPDALLSQILMAATYPFDVVEADRWMTRNPYVTGEALDQALQAKDWDVSVLALCHYPKVLAMMSENLSWTARLGDAFTNQEDDVMDTVQELRARARAAGNLSTTPEQRVIVEDRYISIEPVSPEYVYVPAYDPYLVYGTWWLPLFPPLPIILPGLIITGPRIVFSPRYHVGFGVFGWSRFDWHQRHVVIVDIDRTRRYYRHYRDYDYRGPDRRNWRPDHERRYVRERRAGEIPVYRPPVRPVPPGQRWDRGPDKRDKPDIRDRDKRPDTGPRVIDRDRREIEGRPSGPGIAPPRRDDKDKRPDAGPRIIDRDRRQIEGRPSGPGGPPRRDDKDMRPDAGPRIIDRDGRQIEGRPSGPGGPPPRTPARDRELNRDRRVIDQGKPLEQPRIIDNRQQPSGARPVDRGQPVIRDRVPIGGTEPQNRPPQIEQRSPVGGGQVREPSVKSTPAPRYEPREERPMSPPPQRSMERMDHGDRPGGGMNREGRR